MIVKGIILLGVNARMNLEILEEIVPYKIRISERVFCSAVIVAGGKGTRMESKINKVFMEICEKQTILRVLDVFQENSLINEIILVVNERDKDYCEQVVDKNIYTKLKKVLSGGKRRQDSVSNGLKKVSEEAVVVLVHDGARPLVTHDIIQRSIEEAVKYEAVTTAVPVKDTIKISDADGFVCETPERNTLWAVQTPQVFKKELLLEAYNNAENLNIQATDDAMLVERLGHKIKLVEGSYENIKITTPEDIAIAEAILKYREIGY